jgi:hypothetical protein
MEALEFFQLLREDMIKGFSVFHREFLPIKP